MACSSAFDQVLATDISVLWEEVDMIGFQDDTLGRIGLGKMNNFRHIDLKELWFLWRYGAHCSCVSGDRRDGCLR